MILHNCPILCWLQAGLTTRASQAPQASDESNSTDEPTAAAAKPPIKRFKLLSQHTPNHTLARNSSATSTAGPRNAAEAELDRYLHKTATAADSEIISAVDFWQDGQKSYYYMSSFTSFR